MRVRAGAKMVIDECDENNQSCDLKQIETRNMIASHYHN